MKFFDFLRPKKSLSIKEKEIVMAKIKITDDMLEVINQFKKLQDLIIKNNNKNKKW